MLIRKLAIFVLLVLTSCSGIVAVKGWPWTKDTVSKIRLTWSEDPSTTMKIIWDTKSASGKAQKFYYGLVDHGTNYADYEFKRPLDAFYKYKGMNNAFVHLKNLIPDTKYYFVIKTSKGKLSKRYWFQTMSQSENSRISVIAGGDSRNNRTPRVAANKLVSKLRPHFVLFGGDMTSRDSSSQWEEWFIDWQHTISSDGRITPVVVARGNHERSNESISKLFGTSHGVYYGLTFGTNLLRTYTLNSESAVTGNQLTWLRNDLKKNSDVTWKIAQYHKPMRPHTKNKSENDRIYQAWAPLFYKYGVNIVAESDSHTVKSTYPVRPSSSAGHDEGFVRDDKNGTIYVGEGCWGAPLRRNNDNKSWTMASGSFNQFKWIFIDKGGIDLRTIKVDNANEVESLTDSNRFDIPRNLKIWNPTAGSVISLSPRTNAVAL